MSLKKEIVKVVGKDCSVGESHWTEPTTGRKMVTYSVNHKGVVLQYAIPEEEDEPGVIEDFLEHIAATVKEATK